jgi:hypothetical protein
MEQFPTRPYERECPRNPYEREIASIRQHMARQWELKGLRPYLTPEQKAKPTPPTEQNPILEEILTTVKAILGWTQEKGAPAPAPESEFMDTKEVADLVGVSTKTVLRWVALGNVFPFIPLPGGPDTATVSAGLRSWNGHANGNLGSGNNRP